MQEGSQTAVQDLSGPTPGLLGYNPVSPCASECAYIQSPAVLGITATPFLLAGSDSVSGVPVLDLPMDTEPDCVTVCDEPATNFDLGRDQTPCAISESIPQLFCVAAFSHLASPRHASPSVSQNSPSSQTNHTPFASEDMSTSCAGDLPNEQPNSPLSTEPVSANFPHPIFPLPPSSPGMIDDYSMEYSDDVPVPSLPLPSSPVPSLPLPSSPVQSSSPPNFFASSPRNSLGRSPPTSPGPDENLTAVPSTVHSLKRPHSPGSATTTLGDQNDDSREGPIKKKARGVCSVMVHGIDYYL